MFLRDETDSRQGLHQGMFQDSGVRADGRTKTVEGWSERRLAPPSNARRVRLSLAWNCRLLQALGAGQPASWKLRRQAERDSEELTEYPVSLCVSHSIACAATCAPLRFCMALCARRCGQLHSGRLTRLRRPPPGRQEED